MEENTKRINLAAGTERVEILEGNAVVRQNPREVLISNGTIFAPGQFLSKKFEHYEAEASHLIVNSDALTLDLVLFEKGANGERDVVKGRLEKHTLVDTLHLNDNAKLSKDELIDLIRQNRAWFKSDAEAGKIITQLRKFVATVEKRIEMSDDQRGNAKQRLDTAIKDLDLADDFVLNIPIFRGMKSQHSVTVEICVDTSNNYPTFYLISDNLYVLLIQEGQKVLEEAVNAVTGQLDCSVVEVF